MHRLRLFRTDLPWAVFSAAFFTYKTGYLFGSIDGEELLPVVYRLLDAGLYPGDAFVNAATPPQPIRAAFIYTLAGFGRLTGVEAAAGCLQAFLLVAMALLLMRVTRQLFPAAPWAAALAPVLGMTYFSTWTLGGNAVIDNMLLPHSFAVVGGLAGCALFLDRRFFGAGLVIGLAALYQPLVAGQLAAMLGAVLLFSRSPRWRAAGISLSGFILAVSPLLAASFFMDGERASAIDRTLFAERYFVYKHALHYLPSSYAAVDWLHAAGLLATGLLLLFRYRHPARWQIMTFCCSAIAAMVVYAVLVEGGGWLQVCTAQAFKTSVWLAVLMAIVVAAYVGKGLSLLMPVSPDHPLVITAIMIAITWFTAVIFHAPGTEGRGLGGDWYRAGRYPESDLTRLHRWLRDSTAVQAIVLTSPVDVSLLCEAQRPTPVSFKAFLHRPVEYLRWFDRYHRVYHLPYQAGMAEVHAQSSGQAAIYDELTSAHFDTVCRYDYRIARFDAVPDTATRTIRREGGWVLLARH